MARNPEEHSTFILRYECDCGRWTPCSLKQCKFCSRPNPDFNVSPSFMATPVSKKSVEENTPKEIQRRMIEARRRALAERSG